MRFPAAPTDRLMGSGPGCGGTRDAPVSKHCNRLVLWTISIPWRRVGILLLGKERMRVRVPSGGFGCRSANWLGLTFPSSLFPGSPRWDSAVWGSFLDNGSTPSLGLHALTRGNWSPHPRTIVLPTSSRWHGVAKGSFLTNPEDSASWDAPGNRRSGFDSRSQFPSRLILPVFMGLWMLSRKCHRIQWTKTGDSRPLQLVTWCCSQLLPYKT